MSLPLFPIWSVARSLSFLFSRQLHRVAIFRRHDSPASPCPPQFWSHNPPHGVFSIARFSSIAFLFAAHVGSFRGRTHSRFFMMAGCRGGRLLFFSLFIGPLSGILSPFRPAPQRCTDSPRPSPGARLLLCGLMCSSPLSAPPFLCVHSQG